MHNFNHLLKKGVPKISLTYQRLKSGYTILSIRKLHPISFLRSFQKDTICNLSFLSLNEKGEEVELKVEEKMTGAQLINRLSGFDLPVICIEFILNNEILVSTNLADEIFCRLPSGYNHEYIVNRLSKIES